RSRPSSAPDLTASDAVRRQEAARPRHIPWCRGLAAGYRGWWCGAHRRPCGRSADAGRLEIQEELVIQVEGPGGGGESRIPFGLGQGQRIERRPVTVLVDLGLGDVEVI